MKSSNGSEADMRRILIPVVVLVVAGLTATAALAAAQFNKGPFYNATVTELTASGKATGLGNTAVSAFLTAEEVSVDFQCRNKGQNFAPGHPATSTDVQGPTQMILPRNGQITFNVSLPAPVPSAGDECPNANWDVVVTSVDYLGVTLHIQDGAGNDLLIHGPNDFFA
jgi:hypothetical protein